MRSIVPSILVLTSACAPDDPERPAPGGPTTEVPTTPITTTDPSTTTLETVTSAFPSISAVNFGNGVGGFDAESLYVISPLGKLYEAEVGLPGKWEPHQPVP